MLLRSYEVEEGRRSPTWASRREVTDCDWSFRNIVSSLVDSSCEFSLEKPERGQHQTSSQSFSQCCSATRTMTADWPPSSMLWLWPFISSWPSWLEKKKTAFQLQFHLTRCSHNSLHLTVFFIWEKKSTSPNIIAAASALLHLLIKLAFGLFWDFFYFFKCICKSKTYFLTGELILASHNRWDLRPFTLWHCVSVSTGRFGSWTHLRWPTRCCSTPLGGSKANNWWEDKNVPAALRQH